MWQGTAIHRVKFQLPHRAQHCADGARIGVPSGADYHARERSFPGPEPAVPVASVSGLASKRARSPIATSPGSRYLRVKALSKESKTVGQRESEQGEIALPVECGG